MRRDEFLGVVMMFSMLSGGCLAPTEGDTTSEGQEQVVEASPNTPPPKPQVEEREETGEASAPDPIAGAAGGFGGWVIGTALGTSLGGPLGGFLGAALAAIAGTLGALAPSPKAPPRDFNPGHPPPWNYDAQP
jgi:hypothetical protein